MKGSYSKRERLISYIMVGVMLFHVYTSTLKENVAWAEEQKSPICRIELETESEMAASQSVVKVNYIAEGIEQTSDYKAYRKVIKTDSSGAEIVIKSEEEITLTTNERGMLQYQEIFSREDEEQGEGIYTITYYLQGAADDKTEAESVRFIIDATAPEVVMNCDKADTITNEDVICKIKVKELHFDLCEIKVYAKCKLPSGEEKTICFTKEDATFVNDTETELTFQEDGDYTVYAEVSDVAGNVVSTIENPVTFMIDKTVPEISNISYEDTEGVVGEKHQNIYSNKTIIVKFGVTDLLAGVDSEKVYVTLGNVTDKLPETPLYIAQRLENNVYCVQLPTDIQLTELHNPITIWAVDQAGNETYMVSKNIIYNTLKPEIVMECSNDYTVWTNQDITFRTTVTDNMSGLKEVRYKVNGEIIKKVVFQQLTYTYDYSVTATESASKASGYAVVVEAVNNCGTVHTVKRQVYIDKEKPEVRLSGIDNGQHCNTDQTLRTDVKDVSYKNTKTVYYITRTLDGKTYSVPMDAFFSVQYEDGCNRKLTNQGDYNVYAITTDGAGNVSKSNIISFVIDKTKPLVTVSGVEEGTMSGVSVDLQFECVESFYDNAVINIRVERTMDGDTLVSDMNEIPKGKLTSMKKTFSEDGTYRVTISAADKAGNIAQPMTITFSVDQTKPEIQIKGTDNYEKWAEPVTLQFVVTESFYDGNRISLRGTRMDENGDVEEIELLQIKNSGKISQVSQNFAEDGLYDITITSTDDAGNQESEEIHFTVDQTKPTIHKVMQFDGKYYQFFRLANSLDDIFQDLTVISHKMLLNGVEYNGTDLIKKEGKYSLYVEAVDELGHKSSQNIEFMIDHTPPKIIFTGVENAEVVKESGVVNLALANTDDIITGVRMNDVDYDADTRQLTYTEYGPYQIEVDCIDKAGNCVTQSLYFIYSKPETITMLLVMLVILIATAMVGVVIYNCKKGGKKKR